MLDRSEVEQLQETVTNALNAAADALFLNRIGPIPCLKFPGCDKVGHKITHDPICAKLSTAAGQLQIAVHKLDAILTKPKLDIQKNYCYCGNEADEWVEAWTWKCDSIEIEYE